MTSVLDVAMLGPSGAGKTSLLTSMYAAFGPVTLGTHLVLSAEDAGTSAELNLYRGELEKLGRSLVVREAGLEGTKSFREHTFSLRHQQVTNDKVRAVLRFSDYPGGWVTSGNDELQKRLASSDILLVAVDTPALLAEDGRWHHHFNHPQRVRDVLAEWARQPRGLLALVPLKCERWTKTEPDAEKLAREVYEAYADDLAAVRVSGNVSNLVVVPVETVGSIAFNHYQVKDGQPVAQYQGSPGARYTPRWTTEPLRLAVKAAIYKRQASRSWFDRVFEGVTGDTTRLKRAMETLTQGAHGPSYEPWV